MPKAYIGIAIGSPCVTPDDDDRVKLSATNSFVGCLYVFITVVARAGHR